MINKATILGRVGKKDVKQLNNGSSVCKLSIATTKKYTDNQGAKQEVTTWHYVNVFNKLADIASQYAHVGDLIYIEGEMVSKKVDDKTYHSITASEIKLIPTGKKLAPELQQEVTFHHEDKFNDDIPF